MGNEWNYKLVENVSGTTVYEGNKLSRVILVREKHFRDLKRKYGKVRPYVEYQIHGAKLMDVYTTEMELIKLGKIKELHFAKIDPQPKEFEIPKMNIRPLVEPERRQKRYETEEERKKAAKERLARHYQKNKERIQAKARLKTQMKKILNSH